MYSYMIGKVTLQESVYITLEVNNIGYKIYVANPYFFMIGEEIKVFLYQQIKEDEHSLFGFKSDLERGYAANIVIKVDSNAEPSVRKTE